MANIIIAPGLTAEDKLALMREDAAHDIADGDSIAKGDYSGARDVDMAAIGKSISNIKSKPSPPTVPKVFVSNDCSFNCAYCNCRVSKDKRRYTHNTEDIADMALATANQCGHGVFITSAICKNPDYTEELIIDTLKVIRQKRGYDGYIHAKIMPGTDPLLIRELGFLADRVSINIEMPHSDGFKVLAKQKTKDNIISPMAAVYDFMNELNPRKGIKARSETGRAFAPAGQTTQMMVGSMGETDRTISVLANSLYRKYDLRRVYYSPFDASAHGGYKTPKWRGRRLYQADRLMKLYGMSPDEILPEGSPNLEFDVDPKAGFALRNINMFPVDGYENCGSTIVCKEGIDGPNDERLSETVSRDNWEDTISDYILLKEKNETAPERVRFLDLLKLIVSRTRRTDKIKGKMNVGFAAWEAYLQMLEHEDLSEANVWDIMGQYCDGLCQIAGRYGSLPYYRSLVERFPEWKTELEIAIDALDACANYGGFLWSQGFAFEGEGLEKFRSKEGRKILADEGRRAMQKDMEAIEQFEKILEKEGVSAAPPV